MQRIHMNTDIMTQAAKSAPPVVVSLIAFIGEWSLNNIIGAVTLLYLVLQVGYLLWKWHNERKDRLAARQLSRKRRSASP